MGNQRTNVAASTAAVSNRIVASANMKVGTYTIANASPVVMVVVMVNNMNLRPPSVEKISCRSNFAPVSHE